MDYLLQAIAGKGGALEAFSRALSELAATAVSFDEAIVSVYLPPLCERIASAKREAGWFDFDDMLRLVHETLHGPNGPILVKALRSRYRHALIDEFQDTDAIQWGIFRKVFVESERQNLALLVGDPKQAIYGFRGGDVFTYLDAKEELRSLGAPVIHLTESFRSTAELTLAVNEILDEGFGGGFFTSDGIRYDHPVTCGNEQLVALGHDGKQIAPVRVFVVEASAAARDRARS